MDDSINFDPEFMRGTIEIENMWPDRMLSAKPHAFDS